MKGDIMNKYNNENNKDKKRMILFIIIMIMLIIQLALLIYILVSRNNDNVIIADKDVSDAQSEISYDLNHKQDSDAYTELMGFGQLEINSDFPDVYLINPEDNDVYLSFDVIYGDETMYQSGLIEPGKMEKFDIFSRLNAGEHELIYSISSYDLGSKALLWSGIRQNQQILINK